MTDGKRQRKSGPIHALVYTVIAIILEFFAIFSVILRIDETPLEGSIEGDTLMMTALGAAIAAIFFVLHRVCFGRLRDLRLGFRAHVSRTWTAYALIPLAIIAERTGITGSGAVVLLDRPWFEVMWNGPVVLVYIPIVVDVLRLTTTWILTVLRSERTRP